MACSTAYPHFFHLFFVYVIFLAYMPQDGVIVIVVEVEVVVVVVVVTYL